MDKAIALQSVPREFYRALLELRGKSNLKMKEKEKACEDFIKANQLGASIEEEYLEFCGYKRIKSESVYVNLPNKNNWKISEQSIKNNEKVILLDNDQTAEYLSLTSSSGKQNSDLIQVMNDAYGILKGKSGTTKLSFIEKDLNAKDPWVIYTIQNLSNEARNRKETQVWLLIQGVNCLHTCVISVQDNAFTEEKKQEMITTFKTAIIIYR